MRDGGSGASFGLHFDILDVAVKKIVVIGDQVCADYCPMVESALKDVAEVWCAPRVVNSSVELLDGLREWVLKRQPDVALLAAGILDTRKLCYGENECLIPLSGFERNVRCALKIVMERSTATPVWATITPVDRRRVSGDDDFGYDNETISLYNEEAKEVARRLGAEVLDLYGIVKAASRADSLRPDGMRFDRRGNDFIAHAVAERLTELCRL